ncbi:MAG: malonate transporter subunit MadL [Acidobacteria bacterium]|nr:malonate transporter subunit MadL [Acidobacteriota bacterium]
MVIYGVALLSFCTIVGLYIGDLLGIAIGVQANVGGVGFGMLLVILGSNWLTRREGITPATAQGIAFWNAIYIPIVVAVAAQQNVAGALSGGAVAILAGVLAVVACAALVPAIDRLSRKRPAADAHAARVELVR